MGKGTCGLGITAFKVEFKFGIKIYNIQIVLN